MTESYVGSDPENRTREAAIEAVRETSDRVAMVHFERATERVRPTMSEATQEYYGRIEEDFARDGQLDDRSGGLRSSR